MTHITINGHRIRERSLSGLRPFAYDFALHAAEGTLARIKIAYSFDIHYPSREALSEYVDHLSGRAGFLFQPLLHITSMAHSHTIKVRTSRADGDVWLISVSGDLHNANREHGGVATLALTVDVNPTSFLANHRETANLDDLAQLDPVDAFTRNPDLLAAAAATACDGNHNVLLGATRRGGTTFSNREAWNQRVIALTFDRLGALLESQIIPDGRTVGGNGLPPLRVEMRPAIVQQAEVYWEYSSPDAVSTVLSLGDSLQLVGGQVQVNRYLPDAGIISLDRNADGAGVSMHLSRQSGKVRLLVYAKTQRTVRIEVKYLDDVRSTVARNLRGDQLPQSIINLARLDAVQRVARVKEAVMAIAPNLDERADLVTLARHVHDAAQGDDDIEHGLLSRLINLGGITENPYGGITAPGICERLVALGVVRRVRSIHGGQRRYGLTPSYQALIQGMHELRPVHQALMSERGTVQLS